MIKSAEAAGLAARSATLAAELERATAEVTRLSMQWAAEREQHAVLSAALGYPKQVYRMEVISVLFVFVFVCMNTA